MVTGESTFHKLRNYKCTFIYSHNSNNPNNLIWESKNVLIIRIFFFKCEISDSVKYAPLQWILLGLWPCFTFYKEKFQYFHYSPGETNLGLLNANYKVWGEQPHCPKRHETLHACSYNPVFDLSVASEAVGMNNIPFYRFPWNTMKLNTLFRAS